MRIFENEKLRFLVAGGINTVVGYLFFVMADLLVGKPMAGLGFAALGAVVSLIAAHLVSSIPAFYLYRRVVFRAVGAFLPDFARFQSVYLVPFTINLLVLPLLVWAGMQAIIAQALIIVVNAVLSYFGHKYFTFRRKTAQIPDSTDPV